MKAGKYKLQTWYFQPPRWFSWYRGGTFYLYHLTSQEPIGEHVTGALDYVKENLKDGIVDIEMSTEDEEYTGRIHTSIKVHCKDKETALHFKLAFCDQ